MTDARQTKDFTPQKGTPPSETAPKINEDLEKNIVNHVDDVFEKVMFVNHCAKTCSCALPFCFAMKLTFHETTECSE